MDRGARGGSISAEIACKQACLLLVGAGAALVAWVVANVFTTLWIDLRLVVQRTAVEPAGEESTRGVGVLLFGRHGERVERAMRAGAHRVVLIHPLGPAPGLRAGEREEAERRRNSEIHGGVTLVLPEIGELSNGPTWRAWAMRVGARVVVSSGCGLDIRVAWPEVARVVEVGRYE